MAEGVDWITFAGSSEPTFNRDLGALIRGVKAATRIPVAVITNGSLMRVPVVRSELLAADAVLPTLDAGSPSLFKRINRPPAEFGFERQVEGLAGLNDEETALRDLAAAIGRVRPH